MSMVPMSPLLRTALRIDSVASLALGLPMALLPAQLAEWLALPAPLLFGAGLVALVYGAVLGYAARRRCIAGMVASIVVGGNVLWAAACVALVWVLTPNALGIGFLLVQAAVVAGFAELQWIAARRAMHPGAVQPA